MLNINPGVLVSVIIPAKNSAKYLKECLDSLINQDVGMDRYEIILVDNMSTDQTSIIANCYDIKIITSKAKSASGVRNDGVRHSNGSILAFIDSDCIAPANWVSLVIENIGKSKRRIIGGTCISPKHGTFVETSWAPTSTQYGGPVLALPGANLSLRKEAFLQLGGFREDLVSAEDDDICRRARSIGFDLISIKGLAVIHLGYPKTVLSLYKKAVEHGTSQVSAHGLFKDKIVILTWVWLLVVVLTLLSTFFSVKIFILMVVLLLAIPAIFAYARVQRTSWKNAMLIFPSVYVVSFVALFGRLVGLIRELVLSARRGRF